MPKISPAATDDGTRRLTRYYVCALSAVAIFAVAGQLLVQSQLGRQRSDSKIVNLAGRQRMLGQKICKCAALLVGEASDDESARFLSELRTTLPTWRRTHAAMQLGDAELGLPGSNSPEVTELFAQIEPTFAVMCAAAERLTSNVAANSPDSQAESRRELESRREFKILLGSEAEFLAGMDRIVSQYEAEAQHRVLRLQTVERVLLALTLGVLLLEGCFVFRPAAGRIRAAFSALRSAGNELRRAKDAAESANSAKSKFLAGMSHELRTPLHAILGAAELLRKANPKIAHGDYLEVVEDSSHMLLCLLNDLLDLSRIEAGKLELNATAFDLKEFLECTLSMFRAAAQAKALQLQLVTASDVPRIVTADALRLRQVLANLLSNAVKFTEAGAVKLNVAVHTAGSKRQELYFEVEDTGIGIAAHDRHTIFESFKQVNAADAAAGAGLGLAVASQLVALMGGRLDVQSSPGCGSKFSFAVRCQPDLGHIIQCEEQSDGPALCSTALKILAADDTPVGRRIVADLLHAEGHEACLVADGLQAVTEFERGQFDLVLLDLRMPEIDGAEAAATMRRWERTKGRGRIPIIAVTADAMRPGGTNPSLISDFDDFIAKPFSGELLKHTIARHVRTAHPDRAIDHCSAQASEGALSEENRTAVVLSRLQGRRSLLREIVELFLQELPGLINEVQSAHARQNTHRLKTVIHRLRGQLELLEIREPALLAQSIEQASDAREPIAAARIALLADAQTAIGDAARALIAEELFVP